MNGIIPLAVLVLFSGHGYARTNHSDLDSGIGKPGTADEVVRVVKLTQVDNMFLPAEITVRAGETIQFVVKNGGNHRHEMLIGTTADLKKAAGMRRTDPDSKPDEENLLQLEPGEQKELIWQFTHAGIVEFACPLPGHFKKMRGKIIVEKK